MKITCRDPFDVAKYEKELRAAGWCLPCQGYGQTGTMDYLAVPAVERVEANIERK
jgi:hypothetical protein